MIYTHVQYDVLLPRSWQAFKKGEEKKNRIEKPVRFVRDKIDRQRTTHPNLIPLVLNRFGCIGAVIKSYVYTNTCAG